MGVRHRETPSLTDFVMGTVTNNQSCGANTPSVKTEGHGGYGVTYLPSTSTRPRCTKQPQGCGSYAELQTWAAEAPDMVLMHFATNDIWDGEPTTLILSAFQAVIAEFRKNNPNVIFFCFQDHQAEPQRLRELSHQRRRVGRSPDPCLGFDQFHGLVARLHHRSLRLRL